MIAGLKKEISALGEDIQTLTQQIEDQEAAGVQAAKLRQNETQFYTETHTSLDDTIVAVDDAVEVMEGTQVKQSFIGLSHLKHNAKKKLILTDSRQPASALWTPMGAEGAEMAGVEAELNAISAKSKA